MGISSSTDVVESESSLHEGIQSFIESNPVNALNEIIEVAVGGDLKKRRRLARLRCQDYSKTSWGLMISHPMVADPNSWEGKKFHRRFRMDFAMFAEFLVPLCKENNVFDMKYNSKIPIEIKILAVLRILGRDNDCDTIAELSLIGESTCNSIFKKFVEKFSELFYEKYVYMPTGNEMKEVNEVYSRVGFPGACGSMDGTHVRWLSCPLRLTNACKGKEYFPTLAWMVIVDHNRKIMHCSSSIWGAENDIGICNNDLLVQEIINGKLQDVEYNLFNQYGQPIKMKGGYIIVDGGFQKLPCFIDPDHNAYEEKHLYWSEWLESVRKDVECTFGCLKQRFRFFKNGIRYHNKETISAAMKTVCILHNMLLIRDGMDIFEWANYDPDLTDDMEEQIIFNDNIQLLDDNTAENTLQNIVHKKDTTIIGKSFYASNPLNYQRLKELLIISFSHQYLIGSVIWPKNFSKRSRIAFPKSPAINRIYQAGYSLPDLRGEYFRALYIKPSDLRLIINSEISNNSVGRGLFCAVSVIKGTFFGKFKGNIIASEAHSIDNALEENKYCIRLNAGFVLDCKMNSSGENPICYLSMANSASNCFNISQGTKAKNNCEINIIQNPPSVILYANQQIDPHVELCWLY